jgi:hypothetical protein
VESSACSVCWIVGALVFRGSRMIADCGHMPCRPSPWTGSEIGRRDWIWSVWCVVAGGVVAGIGFGIRGIPLFLDDCGLRSPAGLPVSTDWFGIRTLKSDSILAWLRNRLCS